MHGERKTPIASALHKKVLRYRVFSQATWRLEIATETGGRRKIIARMRMCAATLLYISDELHLIWSTCGIYTMAPSITLGMVLLGVLFVANALPAQIQRDIPEIDRGLEAAKLLYETLKAEQDAEENAPPEMYYQLSAQVQRHTVVLDRSVEAAKFLYDALKAEQDAEAKAPSLQQWAGF